MGTSLPVQSRPIFSYVQFSFQHRCINRSVCAIIAHMDTMIHTEEELRAELASQAAGAMMTAARTAPKAKGKDNLSIVSVDHEGRVQIAQHMRKMVEEKRAASFFLRDAANLEDSDALVLIGTRIKPMRLVHCGLCGLGTCENKERYEQVPCAFNTGDLGIATGSAVSRAADLRVDNRVMFSVGMAVLDLGIMGDDIRIINAIPLSIKGKNIFMDRT